MGTAIRSMVRAIAVTAVVAVTAGMAVGSPATSEDAAAGYAAMDELPTRAEDVTDIEGTAIALAHELGAVAVSEEQYDIACPLERLEVSWDEPVGYEVGTLVTPVGPAPGPDTREVNGVVVCAGSTYAFMGFQAKHEDPWGWRVTAVPNFGHDHDVAEPEPLELRYLDELDPVFGSLADLGPIDDYAPYEPQLLCHAVPKPGAVALAQLLLDAYPETRSYGISRGCHDGPRSEHKEGRAFDWGADVTDREEAAGVEDLLQRLLATDEDGNRHALARRLGVMYIIWDGHIWSSFRADDGWRPYVGPSAHTDHVHISLSWDGAMGRTSLWQVALDAIDLRGIGLAELGALPPADAPVRDDAHLLPGREDERSPAGADDADTSDADRDDGDATVPGSDGDVGDGDQDTGGTVDDTTDTVQDTADETTDTVEDTVDEVTDPLDGAADETDGTVEDTIDDTDGTIDDSTDSLDDGSDSLDDVTGGRTGPRAV